MCFEFIVCLYNFSITVYGKYPDEGLGPGVTSTVPASTVIDCNATPLKPRVASPIGEFKYGSICYTDFVKQLVWSHELNLLRCKPRHGVNNLRPTCRWSVSSHMLWLNPFCYFCSTLRFLTIVFCSCFSRFHGCHLFSLQHSL